MVEKQLIMMAHYLISVTVKSYREKYRNEVSGYNNPAHIAKCINAGMQHHDPHYAEQF